MSPSIIDLEREADNIVPRLPQYASNNIITYETIQEVAEKYLRENDFQMKSCGGNNAVYEDFLYRVQFHVYEKLRAKGFVVKAGLPKVPPPPCLDWPEKELNAAIEFLKEWGLDQFLREYDDPVLWATVVLEHWGCITNPRVVGSHLKFGKFNKGDVGYKGGLWILDLTTWSWPVNISDIRERWEVEGARNAKYQQRLMYGDIWPIAYLNITSPSAGTDEAFVHSGHEMGILAGMGRTTVWRKGAGKWFNTQKEINFWIS